MYNHTKPKTTGKRIIIEWDKGDELRTLIDNNQRLPHRHMDDAHLNCITIDVQSTSYVSMPSDLETRVISPGESHPLASEKARPIGQFEHLTPRSYP